MPRNILNDIQPRLTFGFEADPRSASSGREPRMLTCDLPDAWGPDYPSAGLLMAAGLRAMTTGLSRDDLTLRSASATFRRTPEFGPITTAVEVQPFGDLTAFVGGRLQQHAAASGEVNVTLEAVFTSPRYPGPALQTFARPAEFATPPWGDPATAATIQPSWLSEGMRNNTEWHSAAPHYLPHPDGPRANLWFRFADPPVADDEPWDPSLLPIAGDSLGAAIAAVVDDPDFPPGCDPLQMDLHIHAPITERWLGIEATCTHAGNNLVRGIHNIWSASGLHLATITQTSQLRFMYETVEDEPAPTDDNAGYRHPQP